MPVGMDQRLMDIRTQLAASPTARVEIGEDGVLHVLAGPLTLHLDRAACEELTTTLARAMIVLARSERERRAPRLQLVPVGAERSSVAAAKAAIMTAAAPPSASTTRSPDVTTPAAPPRPLTELAQRSLPRNDPSCAERTTR